MIARRGPRATVPACFQAVARRRAWRPAIGDGATRLTYAELARRVDRIAAAVATLEAPGPVAVLLPHGHAFPSAILGVMSAGRACAPLDADHPLHRNARIARHAGVAAVVSQGEQAAQARALFGESLAVLDLDALPEGPAPDVAAVRPEDVACILYTSGSTGEPKGVFQDHRGVLNDARESMLVGPTVADDRFALLYSPASIAGLRPLLNMLIAGACVEVLHPIALGARGLVEALRAGRLTTLRCSPTMLRHLVQALRPGERLDALRTVVLGGERVDWGDVDAVRRGCGPRTGLWVHLGATECWTLHSQWRVDERVRADGARLPVGGPMPGRRVTLVGEDGRPVRDGEWGEILVSSPHLALGYWREPALTAAAFGTDPDDPASRTYRTGDVARRRPDGLIDFEGRKDQQIKLYGRRIEPGEVEAALRACPGVRDAAVVVRRDAAGAPLALSAYVELLPGTQGLEPRHLSAMAAARLPRFMRPAQVTVLPELPWLPNFKIDRRRLQAIDAERASATPPEAGAGAQKVMRAFEAALGRRAMTAQDSLVSLGGDSMQAVALALELERRCGLTLEDGDVDPARTIAEWSDMVRAVRGPAAPGPAEAASPDPQTPALMAQIAQAHAAGRPLEMSGRPAQHWTAAAHALLSAGRFDLALWTLTQMRQAFPGLRVAKTLAKLMRAMPPQTVQPILQEDPHGRLHVAPRPGAGATLVVFGGGGEAGSGLPLTMLQRWLGLLDANLVYLRPFDEDFYLGGLSPFGEGRQAMLNGLRDLAGRLGAPRILCLGESMGGFAAIGCGLELGAEAVLALGPLTIAGADFNRSGPAMRRRLRRAYPDAGLDLRPTWLAAARRPRLLIAYAEDNWDDRLHAERMQGLPGVELRPQAGRSGHLIGREMMQQGRFLPLLHDAFDPPPAQGAPARGPLLAQA